MKNKLLNIFSILLVGFLGLNFTIETTRKMDKSNLYKVIKVNGKILFVSTGVNLKTGDNYIEGTPLSFASNRDRAAVINKLKGRFILQPNLKGKATVLPATSNIQPRGNGSVLLNLLDIQNYFSDTCVFIGDAEVKLGKEAFPLSQDNFFYVTYQYDGEKIAKKIMSEGQILKISEEALFKIDGKRVPTICTEMTLYYMKNDKAAKIGSFYPVFPPLAEMKAEVEVLLGEMTSYPVERKLDEIATYISEFYGKPQKEDLNDWLYEVFQLGINKEVNFK